MPISLLHRLAEHDLPIAVNDGADVDALRVLSLAGHVRATIPKPVRTIDGYGQPPATVIAITSLGRSMMKRFPIAPDGLPGRAVSRVSLRRAAAPPATPAPG